MRTHIRYPGTALLLWASYSSLLRAAAPLPGAPTCPDHGKSAPASPVLESLECRNDYLTHIRCSWTEIPGASLSLFHLDQVNSSVISVLPCVAGTPLYQSALGQPQAQCWYNTTLFAIGFDDMFFFNTLHSPGLSATVNLTQHARRHHPRVLATNITSEEAWTQDWVELGPSLPAVTPGSLTSTLTSDPNTSHQTPDARLTWRLDQEQLVVTERPKQGGVDRTREVMKEKNRGRDMSKEVRGSELKEQAESRGQMLEEAGLTPPSEYQHAGAQGPWSKWSPLLARWSGGDGQPGPFNLQCVYDRESEVTCSWEMMRELAQYILYRLSYRTKPHAPVEWCCASMADEDDEDDVVRFSCSFSVSAAELLLMHLSPEPRTKVIQSHKHIEPASPAGLHVALMGEDWILKWTLPKYRTVPISAELRYWSTHSPEDIEVMLFPMGVSVYVVAERSLRGSVRYLAQVRSTVSSRRGMGARYAGHPSRWSEPVHWTTRPAPDSSHVYLLLAASVSVALILIYFTVLAFHRRVSVWEVSLPSPFQSKVLEAVCQSRGGHLPSHAEVDDPHMSEAYILDRLELTTYMPTSDWEYNDVTLPPGAHSNEPYQCASEEGCCRTRTNSQAAETWRFGIPYHAFQRGSSVHEGLMGVEVFMSNGILMCLASNSQNALQPCSDGYQPSPLASGDVTQDALLNVDLDDVKMYDAYMACPK
ncbi:cytokine receptor common subunit beta-like isoform X2 [Electrophorus electricus]|uniref:cytokine receptor common subunit beta-like isoform X2 n=1 Tax=Electrophorus electricus TaxID=8005 RepID=UPI0015D0B0FF|nr:cytokine receptor common subunit beta-like isoform X2 [Electrophorus electricus]